MPNWKSITEARYSEMLGAVPPIAHSGAGFLMGEPYDYDSQTGKNTYYAFARELRGESESFFEYSKPVTVATFRALPRPVTP